ncbi:MAG: hypothetical protein HY581_03765 [Nitrospirae bacterium]|nr:hypothetical protein [Nitrospirota bacterium]
MRNITSTLGAVSEWSFLWIIALAFGTGVGCWLPSSALAAEAASATTPTLFASNDGPYTGGRGLITASGPTGMFLNPTSGTLTKGSITAQVFGTVIKPISALPNAGKDQFSYYNGLASYGVTDWLEVGGLAQLADRSNNNDQQSVMAGGGFARVRVLKDQGWVPELSFGGMFFEGNELLDRRTLFLATSKRVAISDNGPIRGFRLHLGGRHFWQKDRTELTFRNWQFLRQRGDEDTVGYVGGELEFPKNIFLVSEVQTKETGDQRVPFSVGLQLRHPDGFGLSVALLRPGLQEGMTAYIGIGINFY